MAYHNIGEDKPSESTEMYLLEIALLRENDQPVPAPLLAQELDISPVSVNEMSRKLVERGLVYYEPYKGLTLTLEGDQIARRILRCRRLWEVFFVEKLGLDPVEADAMACRFEHVTPDILAEQLAFYLNYPQVSPQHEPIPYDHMAHPTHKKAIPMVSLTAGQAGTISKICLDDKSQAFLASQGLMSGAVIEILAAGNDGAILLDIAGQTLSIAPTLTNHIEILPFD